MSIGGVTINCGDCGVVRMARTRGHRQTCCVCGWYDVIQDGASRIVGTGDADLVDVLRARLENGLHIADSDVIRLLDLYAARDTEIAQLTRERDAYRKAKQENDERFMTERDDARARVAQLEAALRLLEDEVSDSGRCSSEFGHHVSEPCRKAVRAALESQ